MTDKERPMTKPNDPAFPEYEAGEIGLTKRELFAAMAMQAMWGNSALFGHPSFDLDGCAAEAIQQADALIAALNKEDKHA